MSIYSRRKQSPTIRVTDEEDTRQRLVTRAAPPPVHRPPSTVRASALDWEERRKAKPANYLLPASIKWFSDLPLDLRPVALAARYPRIVNLIVQSWTSTGACRANFDELLADRRGHRQGFPTDVHREIVALHDHYLRTFLTLED